MPNWIEEGEKGLSLPNLSAQERALMEAQRTSRRESLSLDNVVKALKSEPYNPNVVTDFWQSLLTTSDIIQCPYSPAELKHLAKMDRGSVYVPNFSYPELGGKFPMLGSWAVAEGSSVKDERDTVGWTDTEVVLDAPYRKTTEDQLRKMFSNEGRVGARLKVGILASEASKLLTGHFFDEGEIWSRYLGSRYEGRVVYADFCLDGDVYVDSDLPPRGAYPDMGGRSERVQ